MVGYRAHIMRRYQGMSLHQVAIILGRGRLRTWDDPEAGFSLGLKIIHLNEIDPQEFLSRPGLAALAELAKGDLTTRAESAIAALKAIQTLPEERHQGLREAMLALATITLDPSTINQIGKETGMSIQSLVAFYRQTDVGQGILEQGVEQGVQQGQVRLLAALIRDRFGDDDQIAAIAGLLAQLPEDVSVRILNGATSLNDLLSRVPQARRRQFLIRPSAGGPACSGSPARTDSQGIRTTLPTVCRFSRARCAPAASASGNRVISGVSWPDARAARA
jgi:hypothetical protein